MTAPELKQVAKKYHPTTFVEEVDFVVENGR